MPNTSGESSQLTGLGETLDKSVYLGRAAEGGAAMQPYVWWLG